MALSTRLSIARASRDSSPSTTALPTRGRAKASRTCRSAARGRHRSSRDSIRLAEVDRLESGAAQLGVEPRGLGDVDDQPVEPNHVAAHDLEQLAAKLRILDLVEAVDGRAERSERDS